MNLKFVLNEYALIWNLLFQASITPEIHALKQKLWKNYRKSYHAMYQEKEVLLKDPKNYIPSDDTIYDMVKKTETYKQLFEETENFRLSLMQTWDQNKKEIIKECKEILRMDIRLYHVLVVHPKLDVIDVETIKGKKVNTITWGCAKKNDNSIETLIKIISSIVKKELKDYQSEYHEIVEAIVELAIDNELYTRIEKKSQYLKGEASLAFLKRQIYPYFLMYLGATKEECLTYMMRDKIVFDLDAYTYEKELGKVDFYTFIDFCVRNQKRIVKIAELEII